MLKKSLLCALLGTSLLIAGCASNSGVTTKHEDFQYNEKISRANNLAVAFELGVIKETEAPEGLEISENGSMLMDTARWTSNFYSAAGSSFLPGTSSLGAAFGWGLLFGMLEPKQQDRKMETYLMGYVPAEDAADPGEARLKMAERFLNGMQESFKAQFPDAETKIEHDEGMFVLHSYLWIKSEQLNCDFDENKCGLNVNSVKPSKETAMTAPALGEPFRAWRFMVPDIFVWYYGGFKEDSKLNWFKILSASAPYIPEHQYLYVPPLMKSKSEKMHYPRFFIEKDKVDLFVIPDNPEAIFRDPKYQDMVKKMKD